MFGPPKDVKDECNAHLYIGDDYGDNKATMRCQLPKGHDGPHKKVFREGSVRLEWDVDERAREEEYHRATIECENALDRFVDPESATVYLTEKGFSCDVFASHEEALSSYLGLVSARSPNEKIYITIIADDDGILDIYPE